MRYLLFTVFSFTCFTAISQDPDMPDYRSKKELFTRIMEKDVRADISSFSMAGIDEGVGKLPLKTVPISSSTNSSLSFSDGRIQVTITTADFEPGKHKLGFYDTKYLVKIDNKPYFGDYGKVPKTYVQSVTVVIDKDTVSIPPAACTDLCNPILTYNENGVKKSSNKVYLSADGKKVYVYMLKQERGGSYEATWVIQDKKYLKRVVDFGFLK
jgi:hypothetical protein